MHVADEFEEEEKLHYTTMLREMSNDGVMQLEVKWKVLTENYAELKVYCER